MPHSLISSEYKAEAGVSGQDSWNPPGAGTELTGTEQGLALAGVMLAHAVVAVRCTLAAQVPVLFEDVRLAQRGGSVTVLGEIALIRTAPAHRAGGQELRGRERHTRR